jgi:hypothetical protein
MKKLLWVPILLLPVVAVFWLSFSSWFSHVSEQTVAANYVALSKSEFVTINHPALAKVAPDILARYQAMNNTWQEVVRSYKALALALSAMIMVLAFIASVLMLKKSPNNAFNSDAPNRRAD